MRNDSEITDADLEGYKFIMLDKSHFKNETPEERKAELVGLMKKYVDSGIRLEVYSNHTITTNPLGAFIRAQYRAISSLSSSSKKERTQSRKPVGYWRVHHTT